MVAPAFATCPYLFQERYEEILVPQVKVLVLQNSRCAEQDFHFKPVFRGGTSIPTRSAFISSTNIWSRLTPLSPCPAGFESLLVAGWASHRQPLFFLHAVLQLLSHLFTILLLLVHDTAGDLRWLETK